MLLKVLRVTLGFRGCTHPRERVYRNPKGDEIPLARGPYASATGVSDTCIMVHQSPKYSIAEALAI